MRRPIASIPLEFATHELPPIPMPPASAITMRIVHLLECIHIQRLVSIQYKHIHNFEGFFIVPYMDTARVYFPGGVWTVRWTLDKNFLPEVPTEGVGIPNSQLAILTKILPTRKNAKDDTVRISNGVLHGPDSELKLEPVNIERTNDIDRIFDDAVHRLDAPNTGGGVFNCFYLADVAEALSYGHKHPEGELQGTRGQLEWHNSGYPYPIYITVRDRVDTPGAGFIEALLSPMME